MTLAAFAARPAGFDPNCVGCIHNASRPCARCTECFLYDGGFSGNVYPFREVTDIPAFDRGPDVLVERRAA